MNDSRFNKTFIIQPALGSDSYLSGTTFDNNTIYYNMSNAVSAFTTDLSSLVLNDVGQLTAVDEGNGIGYILKDRVAGNYGSIGENAKDFSFSDDPSTTKGATGAFSFAEGFNTTASGLYSYAGGKDTIASGSQSHAEGTDTIASGAYSHAEGSYTEASGVISHAEGNDTEASQVASHAEGDGTIASGLYSHAEGNDTEASAVASHAEGNYTEASELYSHAEGSYTRASGVISHAEGSYTRASGNFSHAEGSDTEASGVISHAEGLGTEASGSQSHAEGDGTIASGVSSHAEGNDTEASGVYSHAEGNDTIALGTYSHAEGNDTIASGRGSHAEGDNNFARAFGEHSGGIYGTDYIPNNDDTDRLVNYGNGTNYSRDDAFTIYKNGAVRFYRTTTSGITNSSKEGLLIYDSDDNNRPTIHNGTEWKGLAYVDELGISWGDIQGSLLDQTDLVSVLNDKSSLNQPVFNGEVGIVGNLHFKNKGDKIFGGISRSNFIEMYNPQTGGINLRTLNGTSAVNIEGGLNITGQFNTDESIKLDSGKAFEGANNSSFLPYDGLTGNMVLTPSTLGSYGKIRFNYGPNSLEGFRLTDLGDVGIGTTSPSTKLDVVGTIKGTVVVDNNGNTLSQKIDSKTINEPNGSDKVANIVSLTQAEYDAGTPISTTFYIITD
jgi:hypothetical protein